MRRDRERSGWAIVAVTVMLALLAGASTYTHRATFNVIDNAATIVLWIVVLAAVIAIGTALWRQRVTARAGSANSPDGRSFDEDGPIIDLVAVDVTDRPINREAH